MPERAVVAVAVALTVLVAVVVSHLMRTRRQAGRVLASLDSLVVHAPIGIAFLDRDLRFVRANDALTRISGRTLDDVLGLTVDEVTGRPELTVIARGVLESGVPVFDVDVSGVGVDGRPFHALAGYYPVTGADGDIQGVGVVVREVTASVVATGQRDDALRRITRLQRITGALAAADTPADVLAIVLGDVRTAVNADAAALCVRADDRLELLGSDGYTAETIAAWQQFSTHSDTPLAESLRTCRPVVASTREEILVRWPGLAGQLGASRQAAVALPLVVNDTAIGAIGLSFDRELHLTPDDDAFLRAVATQCASTLRRVRLHESETRALSAAEAGTSRLAFLAEASDALASSLDWTTTLHRVASLAVPHLADFAAVFVVEGQDVVALEMVDRDAERGKRLQRVIERWPARLDQSRGVGNLARRGTPILVTDLQAGRRPPTGPDVKHAAAFVDAGFGSVLAVPMRAGQRVVGVIVLADTSPRQLTPDDLVLASELATRAGQAVLNAELFRDRSRVAATLQASLLPPATPSVPGLEVATRFFAVGADIDVGGDFYDVFRLGTTTEPADRWAVVIGDVRGKGTEAATISGAARHAIRAAALRERSPAAMLRQLNELLLVLAEEHDLEPRFCTAVVAVIEPLDRGARVVLAVGGHPPPIILRSDGRTEAVVTTGSLLGVVPDAELADVSLELGANESLVLYTDGVTERHAGTRFFDEEALASVLSRCSGFTATVLAERIETASRAFVEDAPRDDLAIVVVRAPERLATARATSTELPFDQSAATVARRFVSAALRALEFDAAQDAAVLLTSELVTNALLHGTGPLRCALELPDGRLRISVSDGSAVAPQVLGPDPDRTGGRGMYLVESLASDWGIDRRPDGKSVWFELELQP